jgi:hypothetical protein
MNSVLVHLHIHHMSLDPSPLSLQLAPLSKGSSSVQYYPVMAVFDVAATHELTAYYYPMILATFILKLLDYTQRANSVA